MKKIMASVLLLTMALGLGGCSGVQKTVGQLKDELKQDVVADPNPTLAENNQLEVPGIDDISIEETYQPVPTAVEGQVPQVAVALYYASADGKNLVQAEKNIPKVEGMARATVETLLEGPDAASGLVSAIPAGTTLLDINVKADTGLCIVDFSREIAARNSNIAEDVTVYAIANTLCQFPTIKEVEFRVEGQAVTTLSGHSDLSKVVKANAALVKK